MLAVRRWLDVGEIADPARKTPMVARPQSVGGSSDDCRGFRRQSWMRWPGVRALTKEKHMTDDTLALWVGDELFWEPAIDSQEVAASARDGEVTLRGTVGSFREKLMAREAAQRVVGVTSVRNELEVRPLHGFARDDAEVRGAVLQAMMLNSAVPETIDARAEDGVVTLTGKADWQYQRQEAEVVAGNVPGVLLVDDQVELTRRPHAHDVEKSIEKAFKRNAKIDAKGLTVGTSDGTVMLSGEVRSWAEHDEAVAAAWSAPGIVDVEDDIRVVA
jgi:osmotically-inducible protein OsmY